MPPSNKFLNILDRVGMNDMDTREKIMEFFKSRGKAGDLAYDTDLFKGGYVNSLFALEMVVFLEETFRIKIKNKDINEKNFRTIDSITAVVERSIQGKV
jgi:methoxymalonate biosynthesis acyl carrier protein